MNFEKFLEGKINITTGIEQNKWVSIYERYITAKIQLDVIPKSNFKNPICYSDGEEIKYRYLNKSEKEQLLNKYNNDLSEIEKFILENNKG